MSMRSVCNIVVVGSRAGSSGWMGGIGVYRGAGVGAHSGPRVQE